jgi:hypothetical protein
LVLGINAYRFDGRIFRERLGNGAHQALSSVGLAFLLGWRLHR